jgi:hypothetical protein
MPPPRFTSQEKIQLLKQTEPDTCWFDYVGLSLEDRNLEFAKDFCKAYRGSYARRVDAKKSQFIRPIPGFKGDDLSTLSQRNLTCVWKARQSADDLSIPYFHYCDIAIEIGDKHLWTFLPQINQMYSFAMRALVQDGWEKRIATQLILPKNTTDTQPFREYIQAIAETRRHPKFILNHLLQHGILSQQSAGKIFDEKMIRQAFSL